MSNLNESSLLAYIAKTVSVDDRPDFQRGRGRRLVAHETLLSRVQELILPGLKPAEEGVKPAPLRVSITIIEEENRPV